MRYILIISMVVGVTFYIIDGFIPIVQDLNLNLESHLSVFIPLVVVTLFFIFMVFYAFWLAYNLSDLSCDGIYLYAQTMKKNAKIPVENIKSYVKTPFGFRIDLKERTEIGEKIYFSSQQFKIRATRKYLDSLVTKANQ